MVKRIVVCVVISGLFVASCFAGGWLPSWLGGEQEPQIVLTEQQIKEKKGKPIYDDNQRLVGYSISSEEYRNVLGFKALVSRNALYDVYGKPLARVEVIFSEDCRESKHEISKNLTPEQSTFAKDFVNKTLESYPDILTWKKSGEICPRVIEEIFEELTTDQIHMQQLHNDLLLLSLAL